LPEKRIRLHELSRKLLLQGIHERVRPRLRSRPLGLRRRRAGCTRRLRRWRSPTGGSRRLRRWRSPTGCTRRLRRSPTGGSRRLRRWRGPTRRSRRLWWCRSRRFRRSRSFRWRRRSLGLWTGLRRFLGILVLFFVSHFF
jgi:hypothetical protein